MRTPAECFHVGEYIKECLDDHRMTVEELAGRMGGDVSVNFVAIELALYAPTPGLLLGIGCVG